MIEEITTPGKVLSTLKVAEGPFEGATFAPLRAVLALMLIPKLPSPVIFERVTVGVSVLPLDTDTIADVPVLFSVIAASVRLTSLASEYVTVYETGPDEACATLGEEITKLGVAAGNAAIYDTVRFSVAGFVTLGS
ncbi:Uncharacterised protein [BD1-7 clade bacterium]|uniref:Uncharacterized protein n=1 Tax=BD1-7 clade bacterium TaxID=2029982 RepID=A0A5S9NNM8_9GAMM|nr:Uncharacterised protein [BD1-7 clade bacterium]CAA0095032.1 Uncharacterised protein [BD1-7 clade bacterium]